MSPTPTPTATPKPGNISIIPGIGGTSATPPKNTPKSPSTAAADNPGSGGFTSLSLSNDVVQIALAALIAIVVAGGIIFLFSNMSRQPKKEPAVKPPMPVKAAKRPVSPAPKPEAVKPVIKPPPKKKEDLSQDYLYGLVMGKDDRPQEPGSGSIDLPNNGYMKKK